MLPLSDFVLGTAHAILQRWPGPDEQVTTTRSLQEACALEIPAPAAPRRGGKAGTSAGSQQQDRLCLKDLKAQGQLLEIIEFVEVGRAGTWRRLAWPPAQA